MSAEQTRRTPRKRTAAKTTVRIPFAKKRWRYTENNRDFGPFPGEKIQELIQQRKLNSDSILFEEWESRQIRLGEVPEFAATMDVVRKEIEQEELEQSTENTAEAVKSSSRKRLMSGISIVLGGAAVVLIFVQFMLEAPVSPASAFSNNLFPERGITALTTVELKSIEETPETTEPIQAEAKARRSSKRSRSAVSSRTGTLPIGGKGLQIMGTSAGVALSFEDESSGPQKGRSFNPAQAIGVVTPKVSRCVSDEAEARESFQGGDIAFTVAPSGKVTGARIKGSGTVSPTLANCLKRTFVRTRFKGFDGSPQTVNIPVRIRSSSN